LFYLGAQRKYVAFIFPLALRRHCRFLYLTVVFGNTGTCSVAIVSFGPQKAQLLAEITLLPVINFWNLAYIFANAENAFEFISFVAHFVLHILAFTPLSGKFLLALAGVVDPVPVETCRCVWPESRQ